MTDILAFIAGAASSAFFFVADAFFGAAYHKAQLAKLQGVELIIKDKEDEEKCGQEEVKS